MLELIRQIKKDILLKNKTQTINPKITIEIQKSIVIFVILR